MIALALPLPAVIAEGQPNLGNRDLPASQLILTADNVEQIRMVLEAFAGRSKTGVGTIPAASGLVPGEGDGAAARPATTHRRPW